MPCGGAGGQNIEYPRYSSDFEFFFFCFKCILVLLVSCCSGELRCSATALIICLTGPIRVCKIRFVSTGKNC